MAVILARDPLRAPTTARYVLKVCPQCRSEFGSALLTCPGCGAVLEVLTPPADPLVGQVLAERYRILRILGEGGMGRVYLAEHVRMGRLSAVKVMSPSLAPAPDAISRFNREASNASRINHPNVAAIYDFGETADGTMYLAMEYVEGKTLSALVREGRCLPPRAAELTAQIAEGLGAAHHLGIVHRDLKPDNILVTTHPDGREWAKIVDFGIAKTTQTKDQTVTLMGVAVGTPDYMSPEQIAGESLDARTDLYSLALVLFNMLTGALPHAAMTSKQSLVQRLTTPPRTLADVCPNDPWPPRLQKALDRALAPEPDDRYTNVMDFARDVRAATGMPTLGVGGGMAGAVTRQLTPTKAPPVSAKTPPTRSVERRRRRRWPVVLALLLVVGGTLGFVRSQPAAWRAITAGSLSQRSVADRAQALRGVLLRDGHRRSRITPTDSAAALNDSTNQPVLLAGSPAGPRDSLDAGGRAQADSLSPIDGGLRLRRAAMQAIHAPADSTTSQPVAPSTQTAESDAREVMLHVSRAHELTRQLQLKGVGPELRTAYEEYRIFLTEHAGASQTDMLRRELQSALDEALHSCQVARDSVAARGGRAFRCEHPAKTGVLIVEDDSLPASRIP